MGNPNDNVMIDGLSDEEREALAGEDLGTTDDQVEAAAKAVERISDEDEPPAAEAKPTAADTPPADELPPDTEGEAEPVGLRLSAPDTSGLDEQISKLLDDRKEVRAQYRAGDLSAEEADTKIDELEAQLDALRDAKREAAFVERVNRETAEQEYLRTLVDVKKEIKQSEGIDYDANPVLNKQWDERVRALAADEKNADKPFDWFLKEAHKQVMESIDQLAAARGFVRPGGKPLAPSDPGATVRDAVARRRPDVSGTRSLSTLPTAAGEPISGGGEFAGLDSLEGPELEAAVARMTPEQQERWAQQ